MPRVCPGPELVAVARGMTPVGDAGIREPRPISAFERRERRDGGLHAMKSRGIDSRSIEKCLYER